MSYSICLCYTKEKGLFTQLLSENEKDSVLFRSHNEQWKKTMRASIPDTDIKIEINTKKGSKFNTYFYATIKKGDICILDFDKTKLQVLNKGGVERLIAPFGDWDRLFEKIIQVYRESLADVCPASSIGYIEGMQSILDQDDVSIYGEPDDEKPIIWTGKYLVLLYAGGKLKNLLIQLKSASILDETFHNHCYALCRNYLETLSKLDIDINDSRVENLSEIIFAIHDYMHQQKKGKEFLEFYLNKK